MQPTSLRVYFNFQSNKKFFRATISQTPFVSGDSPVREVDLSLDLFQRPPTSPLSLMAPPCHPLPLYFPHGASLSLTSFPSILLALAVSLQIRRYLLHDLSPAICYGYLRPRSDTPPSQPRPRTATLICSAKFSEKATISPVDT